MRPAPWGVYRVYAGRPTLGSCQLELCTSSGTLAPPRRRACAEHLERIYRQGESPIPTAPDVSRFFARCAARVRA